MKQNRKLLLTVCFIVWFLLIALYFVVIYQQTIIPRPLALLFSVLWVAGCGFVVCSLQKAKGELTKAFRIFFILVVLYLWGVTIYLALDTHQIFAVYHLPVVVAPLLSLYLLVGMNYPFWLLIRGLSHSDAGDLTPLRKP